MTSDPTHHASCQASELRKFLFSRICSQTGGRGGDQLSGPDQSGGRWRKVESRVAISTAFCLYGMMGRLVEQVWPQAAPSLSRPVHFWAAPRPPTSRVGPRRSHHVPAQVPSTSPRAAGKWLSIPHPIPEGAPAQLELLRAHSHPDPHVLTERFSFVMYRIELRGWSRSRSRRQRRRLRVRSSCSRHRHWCRCRRSHRYRRRRRRRSCCRCRARPCGHLCRVCGSL
jgi:hypothetical protein